jgi:hypothetical protein
MMGAEINFIQPVNYLTARIVIININLEGKPGLIYEATPIDVLPCGGSVFIPCTKDLFHIPADRNG